MTTHKEALDYVRKEFNKACWTDGVTLSGAIESAIRAYLDARGLVMVPREIDEAGAISLALEDYTMFSRSLWDAMLAAAPDPFK